MSGGHFNHCQYQVTNGLTDIANDQKIEERFPRLSAVLSDLAHELESVLHDLDWDLSGDSYIKEDAKFEQDAISALSSTITGEINKYTGEN